MATSWSTATFAFFLRFHHLCQARSRNVVHRHEPPVTSTPVEIIHEDQERQFIVVNKPGSIVRPSGIVLYCSLLT